MGKWLESTGKNLSPGTYVADIGFGPHEGASGGGCVLTHESMAYGFNRHEAFSVGVSSYGRGVRVKKHEKARHNRPLRASVCSGGVKFP